MRSQRTTTTLGRMTFGIACAALLATTAAAAQDEGYGYYRILEGEATRYGITDEERNVSENEPLLEGDRVAVLSGSRLEVVLPDFSRMRLDQHTDVDFERLRARDNRADEYRLRVFEGDLQITIDERPDEFMLDLEVASVYLLEAGSYRITVDVDRASILVRDGYAEILTDAGSAVARAGEKVTVEGLSDPQVWVEDAGRRDDLERWADANDRSAERSSDYVGQEIGYAAADLDSSGEWIEVGASHAWRPYDRPGWSRPYYSGYWYDTPYGVHWVSEHRWGWLTSHYGYWDFDTHFGWVWYPGAAYSPAWVHWYWGPSYVGWVPSGYYYRHYGYWGYNYYGYVNDGWFGRGHGHWAFSHRSNFGHRRDRVYYDDVAIVSRHKGGLEGGIITTDTRGVRRHNWSRAEETDRILTRNASRTRGGLTYRHPEDLPDAVSYVSRSASKLPTDANATRRLGPTEQVPRSGAGTDLDQRVAGGLVVQRGGRSGSGTGIESRPAPGAAGRSTQVATAPNGRLVESRVTEPAVDSSRSASSRARPVEPARERRIVLPETPSALGRGRERESATSSSPKPEVVERGRTEHRDGWQIERRRAPSGESPRAESRTGGERRAQPAPRTTGSSRVRGRPDSSESPRSTYDRGQRTTSGSTAAPRSAPSRRYDRPAPSRSNGSRAAGRSSTKSGSKASSSSGSSAKSSSDSSSKSSKSGSASRSRSGRG